MFLPATEPKKRELDADGGHWYYPDGRPCHEVPKVGGSEKRPTTLRDARKNGLYPSVTKILDTIDNPGLNRWKQDRIIQACIENPFSEGENPGWYGARIAKIAQKRMVDARVFGSKLHAALEELHVYGFVGEDFADVKEWIKHYIQWQRANNVTIEQIEEVCVNPQWGYAGQLDAIGMVNNKKTIIDFKSQSVKKSDPKDELVPTFYPSWCRQLAAYKNATWPYKPPRIDQVMSLVFNSEEPSYPWVRAWTAKELADGWKAFRYTARVWQALTHYTPPGLTKESEAREVPF